MLSILRLGSSPAGYGLTPSEGGTDGLLPDGAGQLDVPLPPNSVLGERS